ncbi:MAG TPA: transposase [Dysgonamonadaceae bacterium]|nr:transposase [Dysgonamonadaceae bacterium]
MKERKKNRMINFDYSSDNLYFVTSCTKDKICCFGEIINGNMVLNEMGEIAQRQWQWLTEQYPYLKSHAFVVMPNHIHGILEINRDRMVGTGRGYMVGTGRDLSLQKIKTLSELMGAYKTTTSKKIHLLGNNDFAWQRSFHDHVVRNTASHEKITEYITDNPMNWDKDMFNNELL